MADRSTQNPNPHDRGASLAPSEDLLLHRHDFWDPFAVGSWTPHVDICQTEKKIVVRAELPGVEISDISLGFQENSLRLQGIKREPSQSPKLLCYYCLERRYGKFDRQIGIGHIVNPRKAHAYFQRGVLTVELPKIKDRRGKAVEIPIEKK
jgi:HSP20 family protein